MRMPSFQAMSARASDVFGVSKVDVADETHFAPGTDLAATAESIGIAVNPQEKAVLAAIPEGIKEALRAVLYKNLLRPKGKRFTVSFAWAPASDYELTVWEVGPASTIPNSRGGITVLLKTKVPPPPF
jgi:hypothetical protein